jgi:predicted dehydrogenase
VNYEYGEEQSARIDGGWDFPAAFPFRMSFLIRFAGATVEWDSLHGPLVVYPAGEDAMTPELVQDSAYQREIAYFLTCIAQHESPLIVTPEDARESLRLVMTEVEALRSGKTLCFH